MAAGGAYAALPGGIAFAANAAAGRALPVPTAAQRRWADMELGMFFHFDIPVFKPNWNWRSFKDFPDPKLYNPAKLDTDQWMEAAKAYGAKTAAGSSSGRAISIRTALSRRHGGTEKATL